MGVPPGVLRFEVDGAFDSWDKRFRDGRREGLGTDLTGEVDSDLLPLLAPYDTILQRVTGLGGLRLNLGALAADAQADVSGAVLGLTLGVTRSIAVFGRLPLARVRVQTALDLDPAGANAGLNPGAAAQDPFFSQFETALTTLAAQIAAGAYDADPARRALAETTLSQGGVLFDDLFALLGDPTTASPFVPTGGSEAGTALAARVATLQTTLGTDLGVGGFATSPSLPEAPATADEVASAISDPFGPIGLQTGESEVTFRGDAEAGVAVTIADRWDRGGRRGGLRAAAEGLIRFPTGTRARTDRLLAVGTGDGQTDLELRGVVDLGAGAVGVRLEGGYSRQLAGDVVERVAPFTQPFPSRDLLASVRLDPGDVTSLAVRPFFRIARTFALIGSLERWSRGRDAVEYSSEADAIPGVDPGVLAEATDASAALVSIGVTYSNPGALRQGGTGLPVDAGWAYERIVSASGGIVPDTHRIRARLRLYFSVW
ncbi:MAG: hypothetical protein H0T50_13635 [Gemmatimonadales bacterium]|nr:hypothetical protein [Gemmatimonadales bacterium]